MAERLAGGAERPERLILSGLLASERERVAGAYGELGYRLEVARERGDWAALRLGPA